MSSAAIPQPEQRRGGKAMAWLLVLLVLLDAVLGICAERFFIQPRAFTDEVEHSHVVWCLNQGIMPYRDIHQNHAPLLWMITSPILARLPENALTMIALRGICLAACVGIYVVGLFVLREVMGAITGLRALTLLLLFLSVLPSFEWYRYRPDPVMAFCISLAILAAIRLWRAPRLYSLLTGMALGLAATLSPKIAPLCLTVPILCLLECRRSWSLRPLWLVIPNGVGFLLGLIPAVAWLLHLGLFESFWRQTVSGNCHAFNVNNEVLRAALTSDVLTTLAVMGGLLVVTALTERPKQSWPPGAALVVAALLAWSIMVLEPNHFIYNLQSFTMPGMVLGTLAIMKLAESALLPVARRLAITAVVLVFVAGMPILMSVIMSQDGRAIHLADMQRLIDLCQAEEATCVGFAPWHPVFCRDATEVYLNWDLQGVLADWVSDKGKKPFLDMWARAVPDVDKNSPTLVVNQQVWDVAHRGKVVSDEQYDRFKNIVKSRYEPVKVGHVSTFVRKGAAGLQAIKIRDKTHHINYTPNDSTGL
jgi:hypothetical protein